MRDVAALSASWEHFPPMHQSVEALVRFAGMQRQKGKGAAKSNEDTIVDVVEMLKRGR
jgi:hypothetical protein